MPMPGLKAIEGDMERVNSLFPRLQERQGQLRTLSGGEQQMLAG